MLRNREIGIGLGGSSVSLDMMPGWAKGSWGYHGDDGNLFIHDESERGLEWGPRFIEGDVIGCCLSFRKRLIFYTRNGEVMDYAFKDLNFKLPNQPAQDDIYIMIGLRGPGEHVHVNFGKEAFVFDIAGRLEWMENHV